MFSCSYSTVLAEELVLNNRSQAWRSMFELIRPNCEASFCAKLQSIRLSDDLITVIFVYATSDHSMLVLGWMRPLRWSYRNFLVLFGLFIDHLPGAVLFRPNLCCYVLVYHVRTSARTWRRLTQTLGALALRAATHSPCHIVLLLVGRVLPVIVPMSFCTTLFVFHPLIVKKFVAGGTRQRHAYISPHAPGGSEWLGLFTARRCSWTAASLYISLTPGRWDVECRTEATRFTVNKICIRVLLQWCVCMRKIRKFESYLDHRPTLKTCTAVSTKLQNLFSQIRKTKT